MAPPTSSFMTRWWVAVDLIEKILEAGGRRADEAEVYLATGTSVAAMLRKRKISSATGSDHQTLSIRVIRGGRIGVSSTDDPGSWMACLGAALQSAALAAPQEWAACPHLRETPMGLSISTKVSSPTRNECGTSSAAWRRGKQASRGNHLGERTDLAIQGHSRQHARAVLRGQGEHGEHGARDHQGPVHGLRV